MRVKDRKETEAPTCEKSKTESADPTRANVLTDSVLPK